MTSGWRRLDSRPTNDGGIATVGAARWAAGLRGHRPARMYEEGT